MQRFGARQQRHFFRAQTGGFGLRQGEQIFHLHFESLGQPQRNGRVGDVAARFHGVNGLTRHADGSRQLRRGDAALLPEGS